ncbi:Zinc finger MIZ domain-containing protein 1 [Pleurostoma richardsiae]|uniref:Zinc finger MIZ domain-containing protein 1 n=1 Tax=Pleurostoma richardsiae TaxID=41990 RepID=A0AA38VMC6_9PEZI|nr:Zinc finger MIZ domain-containing protein 1 [Pleurostoma richardsiae]
MQRLEAAWGVAACEPSGVNDIAETDWVTLESSWPPNIFFKLNEKTLNIRRHTHNGKDLPVELTSLLIAGQNTLKVVVTQPKAQRCSRYFLAVEVIETLSHSEVMSRVLGLGRLRAEDTLQKIRTRLSTLEEDGDSIAIVVKDLSVDLADPFSATIFKVPARGATCTHMECFDLETWLNTRPAKPNAACLHRVACNCPKSTEPSNPDRWKCPICFKDARPVSLRIDMFLFGVRAQLEKECKLQAKSMLVSADGSWRPVIEAGGEGEDSDGEGGYTPARMARKVTSASAEPNVAVIELLDDD